MVGFPAAFLCVGLVVVVVNVLAFVFWIWMLVDCVTKEPAKGNDKLIWVLVIVLLNALGAAIYYFVRRPQRINEVGR